MSLYAHKLKIIKKSLYCILAVKHLVILLRSFELCFCFGRWMPVVSWKATILTKLNRFSKSVCWTSGTGGCPSRPAAHRRPNSESDRQPTHWIPVKVARPHQRAAFPVHACPISPITCDMKLKVQMSWLLSRQPVPMVAVYVKGRQRKFLCIYQVCF